MPMIMQHDCHCCQEAVRKFEQRLKEAGGDINKIKSKDMQFDFWHDEYCWDRWHNGERDGDYISKEDAMKGVINSIRKKRVI